MVFGCGSRARYRLGAAFGRTLVVATAGVARVFKNSGWVMAIGSSSGLAEEEEEEEEEAEETTKKDKTTTQPILRQHW